MKRRRLIYVQAIVSGLWLSGALWLPLHFFWVRHGKFGTSPHPLEPWMLRLHGGLAFATLWCGGFLWATHIVSGWRGGRRRRTGIALCGAAALLIVSGYLLYYAGGDDMRAVVSLLHWGIGLAAPIAFLAHRLKPTRAKPRRPRLRRRPLGEKTVSLAQELSL